MSLSSDVLPVFREYERSMTTILNAFVMPVVSSYVDELDRRVTDEGIAAPLLLMKSSGGVTSTRTVRRAPVETALSGPAAGAVGAAYVGVSAGHPNLIGIDIGGTSADISLIHGGEPGLTTNGRIGGWPVGLPMVDLVTIGAGGGSIARVSEGGTLIVGPESAGAQPGPVCYGRGGSEPTVTDAHLALGHLPPYLLGGSFALDADAARAAIAKQSPSRWGSASKAPHAGSSPSSTTHGGGHSRGVGGTRPRPARLFALALRWGRAAARRRARPLARHSHHRGAAGAGRALGARAVGVEPQGGVHAHLPAEGRRLRRCRDRPRLPRS